MMKKVELDPIDQPKQNETRTIENRPVGEVRNETRGEDMVRIKTVSNHHGFDVVDVVVFDHQDRPGPEARYVELLDEYLLEFLSDWSRSTAYYGDVPHRVRLVRAMGELSHFSSSIKESESVYEDHQDEEFYIAPDSPIRGFVQFLYDQDAKRREQYKRMLQCGDITFDNLDLYFSDGTKIIIGNDEPEGAVVTSTSIQHSFFGPEFEIRFNQYNSDGQNFGKSEGRMSISFFSGKTKISDLPTREITDHEYRRLESRGRIWANQVHSPQYLSFNGKIKIPSMFGEIAINATGRCMIDLQMYRQENPGFDRSFEIDEDHGDRMPEHMYFTTPAYAYGFSLVTKQWGKFAISGLSPIEFRDDAYDLLVLEPQVKREVRALVEQSDEMFTDMISGKGGGAIFLLHGPPGLGKTLTAESVAEILHRPLYSVSVGELGVSPGEVEDALRSILEMVTSWNAVLLLDEADIFLEARTKDDIVRNAIVGVFLRLLEYHNGVLFLTTNRVQNFDEAFMSRISVIIKYPEFTPEVRKTVWDNIIHSAGLSDAGIDTEWMAIHYDINGRQIKSAIRIAMSLASADGNPCTQEYIERVVARNIEVIEDIQNQRDVDAPVAVSDITDVA